MVALNCHVKLFLLTAKSIPLTAHYISPPQNHFGLLAHVTLARKVLWESIQPSGVPRGSMTQRVCSIRPKFRKIPVQN